MNANLLDETPEDMPVHGGIFFVRQTHLGFCPADVTLHLRPKALVLLNENNPVAEYEYSNLVMWTQTKSSVTLLLQNNLKRLVMKTRGRRDAKKIVLMLHSITAGLESKLNQKLALWGMTSADLHAGPEGESDDEMHTTVSIDMTASQDGQESLGTFKLFHVQQTHMPDQQAIVTLRIDQEGISLLHRLTGMELWTCSWYEIVMWRGDSAAVVIVFSESNRQLELLSDQSTSIVEAMTRKANAVKYSRSQDFVKSETTSAKLPAAQLEYRMNLIDFKSPQVVVHAKWRDSSKLAAIRNVVPFLGGNSSITESYEARKQLKAIFDLADTDGGGSLDVHEIGELLQGLGVVSENGKALSMIELESIMLDMDAFGNEVNFDGFVQWAVGSSQGAGASSMLKRRVEHQKKEVQATASLFDQLDSDADGKIDRSDFKKFVGHVGLSLNDKEFYAAWIGIDRDRSGEVSFEEFFTWYKAQTIDPVAINMHRAIRMTRLIQAAKGAMVYAVDKGNAEGKRALIALFDSVDVVGTGYVQHSQLMSLVRDLQVEADEYDVLMALREMDSTGEGKVDFRKWADWWCGTPSTSQSGILRSKLKLSAFTSKSNGPILSVIAAADEGAGAAEEYLNDLLSAAFAQKSELSGKSLGLFDTDSALRISCQHLIQNPLTDRLLVLIIFFNVGLMAAQTPGQQSTAALAAVNFIIMVIFTLEMFMRILVGGLVRGETAFLNSAWDVFDFLIITAVWVLYAASLVFDVSDKIGFVLAMLRSFRALRFFSHVRNILNSIISNRVMISAVLVLLVFLFLMLYVVGFQLFGGVADVTCGVLDGCEECGEILSECPAAIDCTTLYSDSSSCFRWEPNISQPSDGHFGFDSFEDSLLTMSAIVTFDNWETICNRFRRDSVVTAYFAWPTFALSVVGIGMFTVNLFVAGLAYSYIKVRKASRNLDAPGGVKKTLVEKFLDDGRGAQTNANETGRHILQILNPPLTRRCRRIAQSRIFDLTTTTVVLVNIGFLTADHHQPKPDVQEVFDVAEAVFTVFYTLELLIKLQALGFRQYFQIVLNRLDFVIVVSSLASYWIIYVLEEDTNSKGSAILRMLRMLKLFRAARVAKFVFRSKSVQEMVGKAFSGLDAIISLIIFIFFLLTLSSIAGMHLFHGCSSNIEPYHQPNFDTFWQSFLVSFQIMTGDNWTDLLFEQIDCAGSVAVYYFAFIVFCCTFVLVNLFVAIFMENFELDDEQKRDRQVGLYIKEMAVESSGSKEWVSILQSGIRGVESMLTETGTINVLKSRTVDEFMRGARLTQRTIMATPMQKQIRKVKQSAADCPGAKIFCMCCQNKAGDEQRARKFRRARALLVKPEWQKGGWKKRIFWKYVASTRMFRAVVVLAVVLGAVDIATRGTESQSQIEVWIRVFVFGVFCTEAAIKVVAFHFLGGPDEEVWPDPSTVFELMVVAMHIAAAMDVPYVHFMLPLQTVRILYMVERLHLLVKSFLASLSAVWTVLVLMAGSFVTFGIIGMNLFKGLLWRCNGAELLNRDACEAAGLPWENRPFHWDNILEALNSLFSVWTLQGWSEMWFWTIDTTYVDEAPSKDFSMATSFCFFAGFIMWNSLMLTNLFTGMLCDFFAQTSGSILMTSEQRNWQFMSMFLVESLRLDVTPPPDKEKFGGLASFCFSVVQSRSFKVVVDLTILAGFVSMIGQQAALSIDPTGMMADVLLVLDEYVLLVFTIEAGFTLCGYGPKVYSRDFTTEIIVLATLWVTLLHKLTGIGWAQVQALDFIRALRLISVVRRVHSIKKIHFMVTIAIPQVVNLSSIMVVMFFISGCYAHQLCGDVPRGRDITADANFETVPSAMMFLFQLCTGQSMMRANYECAHAKGPHVLAFFAAFWFVANLLLTNLFIALLLDNFDLMGSEDMAVSDMDIELFKRRWMRSAGRKGSRHSIHDSISLARVRWFIQRPGMGTFSMMPQADPHYFNRVLFELHPEGRSCGTYTRQDVLDCEQGRANIQVQFFDLLLALCHIRFSSSCLTLAEEVSKSALLIEAHEEHASRMLQVYARSFIAKRSVNANGDRAMPGMLWDKTGQPEARLAAGIDYADGPEGRCSVCTLPRPWCECKARAEAEKKRRQLARRGGSDFTMVLTQDKQHDDNAGDHYGSDDDGDAGLSSKKLGWDCAVGVAAFLTLASVISVTRVTPEHVVADAFNRLQSAVDKRKINKRLGIMRSTDVDSSSDSGEDEAPVGLQIKDEVAVDVMVYELRKLNVMTDAELVAAFREYDPESVDEISVKDFHTVLRSLGLSFSPAQFDTLVLAIQLDSAQFYDSAAEAAEGAQTINYVEFVELSAESVGSKVTEVTHAAALQTDGDTERKSHKKFWKFGKIQKEDEDSQPHEAVKFVNPLGDEDDPELDAFESEHSNSFDRESNHTLNGPPLAVQGGSPFDNELLASDSVKFSNPLVAGGAFEDDEQSHDAFPEHDMTSTQSRREKKKLKKQKHKKQKKQKQKTKQPDMDVDPGFLEADFHNDRQGEDLEQSRLEKQKQNMKQRADVFKYKVVAVAELRTDMDPDSTSIPRGHLAVGESVTVTAREQLSVGVVGVQVNGSRFGMEHVYLDVTKSDRTVQLEYLSNDATSFLFRVCTDKPIWCTKSLKYSEATAARSKVYAKTQRCGKLKKGQIVEVHTYQCTDEGVIRLKLHDGKGWVTLMDADDDSTENLRSVDPLDTLRLHLNGLSLSELRSEAVKTYQLNESEVDLVSDESLAVDPTGSLVEMIVQNHENSLRSSDHLVTLIRCAEGLVEWFNPNDRIQIRRIDLKAESRLVGKFGRIVQLTGALDHRGRETAEIILDVERVTRTIAIDDLTKLVDEAIATTLFGAVLTDDPTTLASLIAQEVAPPDAVKLDKSPIPPGHSRVANARDHAGLSLYGAAYMSRKMRCAEYLAVRLMFQAVVDDNVQQLRQLLSEAGTIDCLCPPGAFPPIGDDGPHLPRIGYRPRDGENPELYAIHPQDGEPLIERARMLWECAGSPSSEAGASQLGGQCWLLLSEMWEDCFGAPYRRAKGDEKISGLNSLLTTTHMKKKFEANHDRLVSEQEVEQTLHWKERNAFMTRKTTIS